MKNRKITERKKIRKLIDIIVLLVMFFSLTSRVSAYFFQKLNKGTPEVFEIKLKKLSVHSRENEEWILVRKKPIVINIASENNKLLEKMVNGLPPGEYDKVKYSICATFIMKGYVNHNDSTYYTSKKAKNGTAIVENFNSHAPPTDYSRAFLTVFGYNKGEYFEPREEKINFLVLENEIKNIRIEVNVRDSLALYQTRADPDVYQLMPVQPKVKIFKYSSPR